MRESSPILLVLIFLKHYRSWELPEWFHSLEKDVKLLSRELSVIGGVSKVCEYGIYRNIRIFTTLQ